MRAEPRSGVSAALSWGLKWKRGSASVAWICVCRVTALKAAALGAPFFVCVPPLSASICTEGPQKRGGGPLCTSHKGGLKGQSEKGAPECGELQARTRPLAAQSATSVHSTTSAVDFSKETLVVKKEETYDAGVFERVEAAFSCIGTLLRATTRLIFSRH